MHTCQIQGNWKALSFLNHPLMPLIFGSVRFICDGTSLKFAAEKRQNHPLNRSEKNNYVNCVDLLSLQLTLELGMLCTLDTPCSTGRLNLHHFFHHQLTKSLRVYFVYMERSFLPIPKRKNWSGFKCSRFKK